MTPTDPSSPLPGGVAMSPHQYRLAVVITPDPAHDTVHVTLDAFCVTNSPQQPRGRPIRAFAGRILETETVLWSRHGQRFYGRALKSLLHSMASEVRGNDPTVQSFLLAAGDALDLSAGSLTESDRKKAQVILFEFARPTESGPPVVVLGVSSLNWPKITREAVEWYGGQYRGETLRLARGTYMREDAAAGKDRTASSAEGIVTTPKKYRVRFRYVTVATYEVEALSEGEAYGIARAEYVKGAEPAACEYSHDLDYNPDEDIEESEHGEYDEEPEGD